MIRGFYAAVSGMVANFARAQTISNNLANLGTVGYKEDVNSFRSFRSMLLNRLTPAGIQPIGQLSNGAEISRSILKLDQGSLRETGNPLDIAIDGPGFFAVQTPGGVSYTRTGHLYRDQQNNLVTGDGAAVLGQNGPMVVPNGDVRFTPDGSLQVNGVVLDQLQLVQFANPDSLRKQGANRFQATDAPIAATDTQVRSGFLEESNVDPTKAMVDLMMVQRAYDASQMLTQLADGTLRSAANEVGRVG
ncbi:MAG: flagellar basal-body rod protein FlgF [Chloroflexi bacterium]|nr:flagellar basal-body rod protein FlgF [Chloroflexota bacterium]